MLTTWQKTENLIGLTKKSNRAPRAAKQERESSVFTLTRSPVVA